VWFSNLGVLSRHRLQVRAVSGIRDINPDRWAQRVSLSWRLRGSRETVDQAVWLTFVKAGDHALLAGDVSTADFAIPRPIWLQSPVRIETRGPVAVITADPSADTWLDRATVAFHDAFAAVSAQRLPGDRWSGPLVVEVPSTRPAFEQSLGVPDGSYARIGAAAWPRGSRRGAAAVHVVVNPAVTAELPADALAVLLAHEAVHVATRSVDSAAPTWLTEGFADYVAYAAHPALAPSARRPLQAKVRAGWLPAAPPPESDFASSGAELDLAYAQAWSLCEFIAEGYGVERLRRLYAASDAGTPVASAISSELGIDRAALVQDWRKYLRSSTS
jgi:hypothetical protein